MKNFGQWPVTYNPMQAHFGAVIHNVDEEFYDTYYKMGYITRPDPQPLEDLARLRSDAARRDEYRKDSRSVSR